MAFQRITVDPEICGGKPTIRGVTLPNFTSAGTAGRGRNQESILKAYPYLEPEDIQEALNYATVLAG